MRTIAYYASGFDQQKLAQTAMSHYSNWTNEEQKPIAKVVNFKCGEF
jgi:hypothetical protein